MPRIQTLLAGAKFVPPTRLPINQVLGLRDPLVGVDEDEAVAEPAAQIHRQPDIRPALIDGDRVRGIIELANIEFLVAAHAPMPFARVDIEHVELDALGLDEPEFERAYAFVIAAGEAERQFFGHVPMPHEDELRRCHRIA